MCPRTPLEHMSASCGVYKFLRKSHFNICCEDQETCIKIKVDRYHAGHNVATGLTSPAHPCGTHRNRCIHLQYTLTCPRRQHEENRGSITHCCCALFGNWTMYFDSGDYVFYFNIAKFYNLAVYSKVRA